MDEVVEAAPAKLNLDLYVEGRRADGYHLLDSVVTFTSFGDTLRARSAERTRIEVEGPLAAALTAAGETLVARAFAAIAELTGRRCGFAAVLTKRIPIAAGLGGGSADAAAALRAAARLAGLDRGDPRLRDAARRLGADVPACFAATPVRMRGIGDDLAPAPACAPLSVVLVNPGVPVPTAAVYAALRLAPSPPRPERRGDGPLPAWLVEGRNDLEPPARQVAPVIGTVLEALAATGAPVVRLCGSGGTCFAAFADDAAATTAARSIRERHPGWWVQATRTA